MKSYLASRLAVSPGLHLGLLTLLALVALGGCEGQAPETKTAAQKRLFVSNYPLAYFAERLVGPQVEVDFPVPADVDPAYWTPDADAVASIQEADLIVINGATYESWFEKVSLPASKVIDTTAELKDRFIQVEGETHSHGPEGEHTHSGTAIHTWLDPALAIEQLRALEYALADEMQFLGQQLTENAIALDQDLLSLESAFAARTAPSKGWHVIGSHPLYEYPAKRLEWQLHSVHWEPGETPADAEFEALKQYLETHPAKIMLWEEEPTAETRTRLEAMGLTIVIFRTLSHRPDQGDWLSEMTDNVMRLGDAIDHLKEATP